MKKKKIDWDKVRMWQEINSLKASEMIRQGNYGGAILQLNENPEIEKLLAKQRNRLKDKWRVAKA